MSETSTLISCTGKGKKNQEWYGEKEFAPPTPWSRTRAATVRQDYPVVGKIEDLDLFEFRGRQHVVT
jgi:hypothetical protein